MWRISRFLHLRSSPLPKPRTIRMDGKIGAAEIESPRAPLSTKTRQHRSISAGEFPVSLHYEMKPDNTPPLASTALVILQCSLGGACLGLQAKRWRPAQFTWRRRGGSRPLACVCSIVVRFAPQDADDSFAPPSLRVARHIADTHFARRSIAEKYQFSPADVRGSPGTC